MTNYIMLKHKNNSVQFKSLIVLSFLLLTFSCEKEDTTPKNYY